MRAICPLRARAPPPPTRDTRPRAVRRVASDRPPQPPAPPPPAAPPSFDPADPAFASRLDALATRFLRAALASDAAALAPENGWHADVSRLGRGAADAGKLDAARFAFVLLELASRRWPDAQVAALPSPYRDVVERMHGILEDSGWRLKRPGDTEGEGGADDEEE